ncbi:alpha/beta fold hydrolase [Nocardia africana]|uniref:2-hydroxy-6-oxo-6-phenylhexa-2,4-dienoate hydrolase n=1 Tax=Nocardia africana TaxID=134964 RepID=A0A378WLZ8_9NOCA|nr:alpha/beta hydrolase [Nocardia africana]MCC3316288.1 alpha/beta fold hydrolase [Nocardia africana]SUA41363.1 2-hydroxy-6-oxo-6-phenylhexa-2,4-dienoate hydrolase [Nocardia africana]
MDVSYEATKRELATDQGVLRYHEAGDGPPLLLLHGSGIGVSGWRNYRGNLGTFAQRFHCYVLEFPGFGVSDPVDGHPVLTAGSSVVRFMDALGIESAAMIGNSMGGVVGVNVAMKHPARVSKLITIGGVGPNIFSQNPSEGTRLLQEFADAPSREKLVRWLECMVYDRTLITDERIEERWETAKDPGSHKTLAAMYGSRTFAAQQQMMATSGVPPYWSMLGTVQCPTLLTWGLDDRQCPPDMPMIPMRLIPHAELHIFPNCGHWVMIEAKEAFERVATEFLLR